MGFQYSFIKTQNPSFTYKRRMYYLPCLSCVLIAIHSYCPLYYQNKFKSCFSNHACISFFLSGCICNSPLDICRLKSSVILPIFGRNVWSGTKSAIWNPDFLNTPKLHLFHAECHHTICSISFWDNTSAILSLTACVQIPLCCSNGLILNQSSISFLGASKQWNSKNHTTSWIPSSLIDLKILCGVSNSFCNIDKFCVGAIGVSLRNLIKPLFCCQWETNTDNPSRSSLAISWMTMFFVIIFFMVYSIKIVKKNSLCGVWGRLCVCAIVLFIYNTRNPSYF